MTCPYCGEKRVQRIIYNVGSGHEWVEFQGVCGEAYPVKDGTTCPDCQGESPQQAFSPS